MSGLQLAALALAAILVFWTLGAYNRLMAMRNGLSQAWGKVNEALRQRSEAATPLLQLLQEPLAAESGALQATEAALNEATRAAAQMTAAPVSAAHASAWVTAEALLGAAASRLFALMEQHAALREMPAAQAPVMQWREAEQRLKFARQVFNEAAQAYNQACAQFPTRLLVRGFKFGPAGLI